LAEEASLRRVAALLGAKAGELGPESFGSAYVTAWESCSRWSARSRAACCASRWLIPRYAV